MLSNSVTFTIFTYDELPVCVCVRANAASGVFAGAVLCVVSPAVVLAERPARLLRVPQVPARPAARAGTGVAATHRDAAPTTAAATR